MEVLERSDDTAFIGFPAKGSGAPVELVATGSPQTHGTGYGHVAVGVASVGESFERLTAMGAEVIMGPGIVTPGGPNCAFVRDRDGHAIELVETRTSESENTGFDPNDVILGPADGRRRILHTMLRISDVDAAIRFYVDGLGMKLLERIEIAFRGGVTGLFVGYDARGGHQLELSCYAQMSEPYTHGTGFAHITVAVPDLAATLDRLVAQGVAPVDGLVHDPDGYGFRLVQA
jgi:lactoylglutathione lyase